MELVNSCPLSLLPLYTRVIVRAVISGLKPEIKEQKLLLATTEKTF